MFLEKYFVFLELYEESILTQFISVSEQHHSEHQNCIPTSEPYSQNNLGIKFLQQLTDNGG